jgi:hypothetical protein
MSTASDPSATVPPFRWWLPLLAVLIPCLYLPTLATRFDFADDGVLVYSGPPRPLVDHLRRTWDLTLGDFQSAGPFRPLSWAHWQTAAALLGPHDFAHRLARLVGAILACAALIWLLVELRLHPIGIVLVTTLAMWNPYRNEIWMGLGLTEAFAMPYALAGLACAIRAARSLRPLPWDLGGVLCLLAVLCIKNTFAALVPALVYLRLTADGSSVAEGWRRHRWRSCWYLAMLLLPIGHFVVLKLYPRPTHHATSFTWDQFVSLIKAVGGAISWDLLAPGVLLAILAIWMGRTRGRAPNTTGTVEARPSRALAIRAGLLLLICGTAIYLPIHGVSGRYTMPAVWGMDLLLAVLFSALAVVPSRLWRRLALGSLACALLAMAVSNVGRQEKLMARNALLWQALEHLEREIPRGATVAWLGMPDVAGDVRELPFSEQVHFQAHLAARGRSDIDVKPICRHECHELPALVLSGTPLDAAAGDYRLVREFRTHFWAGHKSFQCYLWERRSPRTGPPLARGEIKP